MATAAQPVSDPKNGSAAGTSPVPNLNGPALHVESRGLLVLAIMGATLLQILDTTIANVAIPHMQSSLGATMETVTWVLTSYIIASAIATPVTGWLADRIGRRQLLLISVALFIVSSMLCGLSTSLEEMVLFRVLQGITGAFISPLAQSFMLDIHAPKDHPKAMSIWAMGIMIGPIMGPVLGGLLTEHLNWRWVFFVNVPIGAMSLALLFALLPRTDKVTRSFDFIGFGSIAIALGSLQLLLDRGQQLDWFESGEIWVETILCLSMIWIFIIRILTAERPLFSRQLFADRSFIAALIFITIVGMIMFASMALLPPLLQGMFGYSVVQTGLAMAPRGLGVLLATAVAGRLMSTVDPRWLIAIGFGIATYAAYLMTGWSPDMDWHPIVLSAFVQGIGFGFVFIPLNSMAFATLSPAMRTDGASLLNLFRSIGSSIGISIVTFLLARNVQVNHAELAEHISATTLANLDASTVDRYQDMGQTAAAMADMMINKQALMIAYLNDFLFVTMLGLFAIPLVLMLKKPPKASGGGPPMDGH